MNRATQVWAIGSCLALVAAATALGLMVRFYWVEPEAVAQGCAAANLGWRCVLRQYAVWGFLHNAFGIAALSAGIAATIARWRALAGLAVVLGVLGAVLYRYELSGAGLLLGALVWVRSWEPVRTQSA